MKLKNKMELYNHKFVIDIVTNLQLIERNKQNKKLTYVERENVRFRRISTSFTKNGLASEFGISRQIITGNLIGKRKPDVQFVELHTSCLTFHTNFVCRQYGIYVSPVTFRLANKALMNMATY